MMITSNSSPNAICGAMDPAPRRQISAPRLSTISNSLQTPNRRPSIVQSSLAMPRVENVVYSSKEEKGAMNTRQSSRNGRMEQIVAPNSSQNRLRPSSQPRPSDGNAETAMGGAGRLRLSQIKRAPRSKAKLVTCSKPSETQVTQVTNQINIAEQDCSIKCKENNSARMTPTLSASDKGTQILYHTLIPDVCFSSPSTMGSKLSLGSINAMEGNGDGCAAVMYEELVPPSSINSVSKSEEAPIMYEELIPSSDQMNPIEMEEAPIMYEELIPRSVHMDSLINDSTSMQEPVMMYEELDVNRYSSTNSLRKQSMKSPSRVSCLSIDNGKSVEGKLPESGSGRVATRGKDDRTLAPNQVLEGAGNQPSGRAVRESISPTVQRVIAADAGARVSRRRSNSSSMIYGTSPSHRSSASQLVPESQKPGGKRMGQSQLSRYSSKEADYASPAPIRPRSNSFTKGGDRNEEIRRKAAQEELEKEKKNMKEKKGWFGKLKESFSKRTSSQ